MHVFPLMKLLDDSIGNLPDTIPNRWVRALATSARAGFDECTPCLLSNNSEDLNGISEDS